MARCDLSIHLASGTTRCVRGEVVRGEIAVESDGDLQCDDLTIRCGWATHGKGSRDQLWQPEVSLYQGPLQAGLPRRFPFEVEIPTAGPVAYQGHYVNVAWYLQARADVP